MASMRRTRSFRTISRHARVLRAAMLGASALSLVAASGASAQFAYGYAGTYRAPVYEDDMAPMPPRAIVFRLQDRGFSEIGRPRFDGRAYVVDATNPAGNRVRLYLDAGDGAIFGRQRLDAPPARVARAAPGYGWTEDAAGVRRGPRDPDSMLPPGDIPLPRPSLHTEIERGPKLAARPSAPDPNAFGVNPDVRPSAKPDARKADKAAQRKTAKLTPPAKPAAPRAAPEAPMPTVSPAEAAPNAVATPEPAKLPDVAKAPDPAKADVDLPKGETAPLLPAAKLPVSEEKATEKPVETPAASQISEKPAEAAKPAQAAEKPAEVPAAPQVAEKPAAATPAEKSLEQAATSKPTQEKQAAAPAPAAPKEAANQQWQDPPAGEARRKVRIIGGTSTAPGAPSGDAAAPAAN